MCEATRFATRLLEEWVSQHQESFPPIVVNISEGMSTDGDPREPAAAVRSLTTADGRALFFNCDLSYWQVEEILFPGPAPPLLPDAYLGSTLFEMCSEIPDRLRDVAGKRFGLEIAKGARGLVCNADMVGLMHILRLVADAGTCFD